MAAVRLIDFEPAMRGEREYEFAGVGVRRRLLAWAILHRYSNLRWWMQRLPEPSRATLDALADRWFATS